MIMEDASGHGNFHGREKNANRAEALSVEKDHSLLHR